MQTFKESDDQCYFKTINQQFVTSFQKEQNMDVIAKQIIVGECLSLSESDSIAPCNNFGTEFIDYGNEYFNELRAKCIIKNNCYINKTDKNVKCKFRY